MFERAYLIVSGAKNRDYIRLVNPRYVRSLRQQGCEVCDIGIEYRYTAFDYGREPSLPQQGLSLPECILQLPEHRQQHKQRLVEPNHR